MKILLCGFMAAGKSTILKMLANDSSGYLPIDLDQFILENYQEEDFDDLATLIDQLGFAKFRQLESNALQKVLRMPGNWLVGLGGGALEAAENLQSILDCSDCKLVWLNTPFAVCLERLQHDSSRPLARDLTPQKLEEKYLLRVASYQQAEIHLDLEQQSKLKSVSDLLNSSSH